MKGKAKAPTWLSVVQKHMLHAESIRYFGGLAGIRDDGLLDSAIDRPRNKFAIEGETNLFVLAAAYAFGIARNHAFIDGNKRTALLSIRAFLFRNGYAFAPEESDAVAMIEELAAGTIDESVLAKWIEASTSKTKPPVP